MFQGAVSTWRRHVAAKRAYSQLARRRAAEKLATGDPSRTHDLGLFSHCTRNANCLPARRSLAIHVHATNGVATGVYDIQCIHCNETLHNRLQTYTYIIDLFPRSQCSRVFIRLSVRSILCV